MDVLKSAGHPSEVLALVKFSLGYGKQVLPKFDFSTMSPSLRRCFELLNLTSRSFATVIQALDEELRSAICIFYLILRALDTVEDDMTITEEVKVPLLKEFHTRLYDSQWCFMDSKEKDKAVLEEFPIISAEFRNLKTEFRTVISEITMKMGSGMTVFLSEEVKSMEEWDEYCHYVAGLVGIGLTRLFAASGLESDEVGEMHQLANSMGLFLQKTNIIRDYLEDNLQEREFWPREAWEKFAPKLRDFRDRSNVDSAVQCMNLLITNALKHVLDVIQFMSSIKNQSVFNFCAIPQLSNETTSHLVYEQLDTMAIATLALCYENKSVFKQVVKIRKGEALQLIMESTSMEHLKRIMTYYSNMILSKINPSDPLCSETREVLHNIIEICGNGDSSLASSNSLSLIDQYKAPVLSTVALVVLSYVYWYTA